MIADILRNFAAECGGNLLFGIPRWSKGLDFDDDCSIVNFSLNDIWLVVANVTRMALALAALLAIGFIIFGGITYITSKGNPEQTKRAQDIIANSVLGLVLAIFASAIVGFIAGKLN